jgi:capsular exopolysaccharide synthesis family protein
MAFCGAFGAGVGVAFLRAILDPSMRRGGDVTRIVHMPFLGALPKVRFESEILDDDCVRLHERMRMIRTAFLDRVEKGESCSVLITSPGEGAGKTSVSILLAKSLASLGKKVLLVDADFRRSGLTRRLDIASPFGLMDVLQGKSNDEEVKVRNRLPRVDVIPSGVMHSEDDAELIADKRFTDRMNRWKEEYDFIVLDGPPILPVADARIMAGQVDGTILTLRAAHCRRADAMEAVNLLGLCGGVSYGSILVGTDGSREGDHFNYGYGGYAATAIVSSAK